jgi:hypothetical protein
MSIAVWERDLVEHSRSTRSLPDAQGLAFRYEFLHCLAVAALLLAAFASSLLPIAISLSLGAALLAILHFVPIGNDERTALADLVLLTPVAFLFAKPLL